MNAMTEALQEHLPADLEDGRRLPGTRPVPDGQWLHRDDAYSAQMAYRRRLIAEQRFSVLWQDVDAADAVDELFSEALTQLPTLGFQQSANHIHCPDGHVVDIEHDTPLAVLGQIVQEDLCLLQKRGQEHVLTAAVLCFPASWTLAEKAGKPLSVIHGPVAEYDEPLARRVQRLFDGVQVGKPLWRNNMLRYSDPDLHQPLSETDPARQQPQDPSGAFIRAERQSILRLPKTNAVVFSIHSYVVRSSE